MTAEVLLLSRWQAATLYMRDINSLIEELSMINSNNYVKELSNSSREPYRAVLRDVRLQLKNTIDNIENQLDGREPIYTNVINNQKDLWDPIFACYESLQDCGMQAIADGSIIDLLRCISCFGTHLVRHDIRQHSERHSRVLEEICSHLDLGD